ncbi:MAG TPA: extracellular solute-binding protein [Aliidongia sp.]|nr:extracellular solute-binding protein [Aliidongia sp.]
MRGILILTALVSAALSAPPARAADSAGQIVTVYSDRHQVEDKALFDVFTKETGIRVDLVDDDFDPLLERLQHEGSKSPADLLISAGEATLARTAEAGLFRPLPALPSLPPEFRDPAGNWIGLSYWARVIVYHKDRADPAQLRNYEDLSDPQLHGRIVVRSAGSPYNAALVASMIVADGTEDTETWARGLVANFARPPQGGDGSQLEAISAGEGDVTVVNTRYWSRFAASDKVTEQEVVADLGLIFPNQDNRGTQIDLIGAGILKTAPHLSAASSLLAFLLRPDVQEKFAAANFEFPILPGVSPAPVLKALGPFKIDKAAIGKLGRFTPEAQDVMAKSGWE